MPAIVVGTAGHIDHGKTALVRALTGIETDRLKEERERGITIELGFAHLDVEGQRLAVVDVPGHERFIRTMVAGASGVDLVLLVVAVDEGVMPQTREHLDVCSLLGVRGGLVALCKCDLADPELRGLAEEDVRGLVRGTFLEGAPIVHCSAHSGEGIDELRAQILRRAASLAGRNAAGLLRLPLDRVFSIRGFGTVVTGTLLGGQVTTGDDVVVLPRGIGAKVRGVQVHGQAVGRAGAGQRAAVNLGQVEREKIERGEVLAHPDTLAAGRLLGVELRQLASASHPLRAGSQWLFHIGTGQRLCCCDLLGRLEVQPGESALAELRLDQPVVALPEDRFILRGFRPQKNHGTTVGGGRIIQVLRRPTRKRGLAGRQAAAALAVELGRLREAGAEERIALEVLAAGAAGLGPAELHMRLPWAPQAVQPWLARLLSSRTLILVERERGVLVHGEVYRQLGAALLAEIDSFHRQQPARPGMSREELRSRLPAELSPRLFGLLLEDLARRSELLAERELVMRPGHAPAQAAADLLPLRDRVAAFYETCGLTPPRLSELGAALAGQGKPTAGTLAGAMAGAGARARAGTGPTAETEKDLAAVVEMLSHARTLTRVKPDLYFAARIVGELRERLRAFLQTHGEITAQEFKELCGVSRKYVIPLAEFFDAEKLTLRVGEVRRLR